VEMACGTNFNVVNRVLEGKLFGMGFPGIGFPGPKLQSSPNDGPGHGHGARCASAAESQLFSGDSIAAPPFPRTVLPLMLNEDDFQYAFEHTKVILEPERTIETFGSTSFRFTLVTELMDYVDRVRVRDGRIEADRPRLVAPHLFQKMLLEGFGEEARGYADHIEANAQHMKILRYGFHLRKIDLSEELVHDHKDAVIDRLSEEIRRRGDTMSVLMEGVDKGWEVALVKFTMDLIKRSAGGNIGEWQDRGLL